MIKNTTKFKETEIGTIPEEWVFEPLEKHADIIMGQSPESIFYNSGGEGLSFLQGIRTFGEKYPTFDTWTAKVTKLAKKGSVLLSVRAPVGEVNITDRDICIGRGLMAINAKNNEFIYQLFKAFKSYVVGKETGTVYGSVTRDDVAKLKFPFPPEQEQKQIAEILSSLDDKIELNRQINANLEKIASSLFKHWFVDFEFPFDLVRQNSPQVTQGRPDKNGKPYKFSGGKMIDSELGEIPEGWKVRKFSDIAEITSGKRPGDKVENKTDEFNIPLLGASSVMGYVKNCLYNEPLLITGRVGTHGVIQKVNYPCWPSDNTLIIKSKYLEFANQILKSFDFESLNCGSTQPLITQSDLKNISVIVPSIKYIELFEGLMSSLASMVSDNINQNANLNQIRDSLLPRLMNGKIRVNI